MADKEPRLFVAKSSFATWLNDQQRLVQQGTLINEDDPVYKGRENLFAPFNPKVHDAPVEQATAGPGEKRAR